MCGIIGYDGRFDPEALARGLGVAQPPNGTATSVEEAVAIATRIGYPVLVRPSYVLGGRAMQIVHDVAHLETAMDELTRFGSLGREGGLSAERPVLIDRFLEDAFEFDVDAVADGTGAVVIGGIMEHIEEAGIHSGDSSCVVPPFLCSDRDLATTGVYTRRIARALKVAPPNLATALDALERRELVERRTHPQDRRSRVVVLTQAGRTMIAGAEAAAERAESAATNRAGTPNAIAASRNTKLSRSRSGAKSPARDSFASPSSSRTASIQLASPASGASRPMQTERG